MKITKRFSISLLSATMLMSMNSYANDYVKPGEICPSNLRHVTLAEVQANTQKYCEMIGMWSIVRIGDGASISGRGYGCPVFQNDTRGMGETICTDQPTLSTLSPKTLFTDDKNFLLTADEWIDIQNYVSTSFALPTDEPSMRLQLHMPSDLAYSAEFQALANLYTQVKSNARNWRVDTYPSAVNLAHTIHSYAGDIEDYYGPLIEAIDDFIDNDNDGSAEFAQVLLADLAATAEENQLEAQHVFEKIQQFSANNNEYHAALVRMQDGFKKDVLSQRLEQVRQRLANAHATLNDVEDEYQHYVTVAATTPTYAWVPFYGWVAAPVVAGIFGSKAAQAMSAMHDVENEIHELEQSERHLVITIQAYDASVNSLKSTEQSLQEAQQSVAKIEAHWQFIKNDLGEIVKDLDDVNSSLEKRSAIKARLAKIKLEGRNGVINDWKEVGNKAYQFMANAYAVYSE
ncbi:alpha-xenorhabdolysin family binary toxin subunit A [Pseudoalteromonas sp. T1lg23B]|uniref:alpha-xenorhabdolysin family binary toxin subunit A n=1 Tax=Pseudoalteromonas sp. T1lg23B TaxID=2077097 RepID=UPI000CF5EA4A|nr:alpha-xenorhabdolysin family binary toxin subunit A [Pseudoalteromonas sp. T1lg23B]